MLDAGNTPLLALDGPGLGLAAIFLAWGEKNGDCIGMRIAKKPCGLFAGCVGVGITGNWVLQLHPCHWGVVGGGQRI